MTKAEKRERRQARHELQAEVRKALGLRFRLDHTPAQYKAAVKTLSARVVSEVLDHA